MRNSKKKELHGKWKSPTYNSWYNMLQRCYNTKNVKYYLYGGNGVTVCDEWKNSFVSFFEDMGERPENMTLHRKRGAKEYNKENCEWQTLSIQSFDQAIRKDNISGVTGVSKYKNAWTADIHVNGKRIRIGSFKTKEEAITARLAAELEYYGFYKNRNINEEF